MKKQIFTLIINTAIFITNPLFAMGVPEDQHAYSTCKKEMVKFPSNKIEISINWGRRGSSYI